MQLSKISCKPQMQSFRHVDPLTEVFDHRLHQHIERALTHFGHDRLTTREQHVVQLILLGLPSKVAARKLRIAPKTEGVHRRNAYAKLGVHSQAELFRQFLGFLSASWVSSSPSTDTIR